ncbi:hypothetical protein MJ561_00675 [Klebsiella pneumoniae]|nr:hypothetical protein MJ561_00675 [Klebsiella pneumoniae]
MWTVLTAFVGYLVASGEVYGETASADATATLQPMNTLVADLSDPDELDIFGVVTHIIHRPKVYLMFARPMWCFYASCERVFARTEGSR